MARERALALSRSKGRIRLECFYQASSILRLTDRSRDSAHSFAQSRARELETRVEFSEEELEVSLTSTFFTYVNLIGKRNE